MRRPVLPILLLLLTLALAGCGRKGPVRPLAQPLPSAPPGFSIEQKGPRFLLAWSLPQVNLDGTPLEGLERFEVYKMSYNPLEDCPECRDTSVPFVEIAVDFPGKGVREGDRFLYWDQEVQPGTGYRYRVYPVTRRGLTGEAAQAQRTCLPPPPSPEGLRVVEHDSWLRLDWSPVVDDGSVIGYAVYRRLVDDSAFPLQPVHADLLTEPTYEDFGLENGQTYVYAVRTIAQQGEFRAESLFSKPLSGTPQPGR